MPNWAYGQVEVTGKPQDIENFCKLFLFEEKKTPQEYFARSFANINWDYFKKEQNNFKDNCISFGIDFAWSVTNCIIDGYPTDKNNLKLIKKKRIEEKRIEKLTKNQKKQHKILEVIENDNKDGGVCITLMEACKRYNVKVIIESEEMGAGFTENIICNKGELELNECEDIKTEDLICKKCGEKQEIMVGNRDIVDVEEECNNCGKYEWEKNKMPSKYKKEN